jgi:hypothetical protein
MRNLSRSASSGLHGTESPYARLDAAMTTIAYRAIRALLRSSRVIFHLSQSKAKRADMGSIILPKKVTVPGTHSVARNHRFRFGKVLRSTEYSFRPPGSIAVWTMPRASSGRGIMAAPSALQCWPLSLSRLRDRHRWPAWCTRLREVARTPSS